VSGPSRLEVNLTGFLTNFLRPHKPTQRWRPPSPFTDCEHLGIRNCCSFSENAVTSGRSSTTHDCRSVCGVHRRTTIERHCQVAIAGRWVQRKWGHYRRRSKRSQISSSKAFDALALAALRALDEATAFDFEPLESLSRRLNLASCAVQLRGHSACNCSIW